MPWSTTENMLSEINQWGKDMCRFHLHEISGIGVFLEKGSLLVVSQGWGDFRDKWWSGLQGLLLQWWNMKLRVVMLTQLSTYMWKYSITYFWNDWVIGFVNCISTILYGILSEICSEPNLSTEKQSSPKIASRRIASWEKRGVEKQQVDCFPLVCGKN